MRTVSPLAAALALLVTAALTAPAAASAREVAGVSLPDSVTVEGAGPLALNGAGIRKKFIIKVYVGALYVAQASKDAEAILKADAPRRVRLVFLRDVDRKAILGAFKEGFEKNSAAELATLLPQLDRLGGAIGDVKEKGEILFTYVPGIGTTVTGPAGTVTVEGKGFADALLRNWIGAHPADGDLKKGMLGG